MRSTIPCALVLAAGAFCTTANAAYVHTFADGDAFDNDTAGSTAGPFTDPVSGQSGTVTSVSFGSGTFWASGGSQSGVNNSSLSGTEEWVIEWDKPTQFVSIDLSALSPGLNASVQSDAWIGASITPGDATNVSFNSATGTFSLDGNETGDAFDQSELYGTSAIPIIAAGTNVRFFTATASSYSFQAMGFNILVPEPASLSLLSLGALALRRRKR